MQDFLSVFEKNQLLCNLGDMWHVCYINLKAKYSTKDLKQVTTLK